MSSKTPPQCWNIAPDVEFDLSQPCIMGVLNVTPDSFHDGGQYVDSEQALIHAKTMVSDGAAIIDVGGESTRPGADRVSVAQQIDRTAETIEKIRSELECVISIDTTLAPVAEAALQAGADVINDVSAGLEDPEILSLASQQGCGLILMHRLVSPEKDSYSHEYASEPDYGDAGVVSHVLSFLLERKHVAESAGVAERSIIFDPGLGFGKSVEQNLALLSGVQQISAAGRPVLIGASRKSFIGAVTGVEAVADRLPGSLAAAVVAVKNGAAIIRTHDVRATVDAVAMAAAIRDIGTPAPDTMWEPADRQDSGQHES